MILTHVKSGRGEEMGLFRKTERNSQTAVWGWGVSWGQIIQGLEEWEQGVWTNVGRRQKSQDSAPRPKPHRDFYFLQRREAHYPSGNPAQCKRNVTLWLLLLILDLLLLLWKKLCMQKGRQEKSP